MSLPSGSTRRASIRRTLQHLSNAMVLTGAWEPQVMTEEQMKSMKVAAHGTAIHLGHIDAFCTIRQ